MKKIVFLALSVVSVCAFALAAGCADSKESKEVNEYIWELGKSDTKETASYKVEEKIEADTTPEEQKIPEDEKDKYKAVNTKPDGTYITKYIKYTPTGAFNNFTNFGSVESKLYPGAIVDIKDNGLSPVILDQSPITMSINLATTTDEANYRPYVINIPSKSEAEIGVNKLVNSVKGSKIPANIELTSQDVSNAMDLSLALGVNISAWSFSFGADFNYNYAENYNEVVVVLKQVYYRISIDGKSSASKYFDANVGEDKIQKALEGTIPTVVSSVEYGRLAYITIKSKNRLENIGGKIGMSYANLVSLQGELNSKANSKDISVSAKIYGGTVNNGSMLGTAMSLDEVINEFNKDYAPEDMAAAVPISYYFSHLSDFSDAKILFATDDVYIKQYVPKYTTLRFDLNKIEILDKDGHVGKADNLKIGNLIINAHMEQYNNDNICVGEYGFRDKNGNALAVNELPFQGTFTINSNGEVKFNGVSFDIRIDNEYLTNDKLLYFYLGGTKMRMDATDVNVSTSTSGILWWRKTTTTVTEDTKTFDFEIASNYRVATLARILDVDGFCFDAQTGDDVNSTRVRLYFSADVLS